MKRIILATCLFVVANAQYGRGRGYGYGRGYGNRGYHVGYGYGSYDGYGGPGYGHPGRVPGPFAPPHPHPGYGYEHPRYYPRDDHDCKDKEDVPVDHDEAPVSPAVYDDYDQGHPGYYPRTPGGHQGRPGAGHRGHGGGNRGQGGGNRRRVKPAVRPTIADNDKEPIAADDRITGAFNLDARKKVHTDPNEVSGLTGSDTEPIKDIFLGGVDDKAVDAQDPRNVWAEAN